MDHYMSEAKKGIERLEEPNTTYQLTEQLLKTKIRSMNLCTTRTKDKKAYDSMSQWQCNASMSLRAYVKNSTRPLEKTLTGYHFWNGPNYLLHMVDIKLYAQTEQITDSLIHAKVKSKSTTKGVAGWES